MSVTQKRVVLSAGIKPMNYNIHLFDLELHGRFHYQGDVKITIRIDLATPIIVLNAHELTIHRAHISVTQDGVPLELQAMDISYDTQKQHVLLQFSEDVPPATTALLHIEFKGKIQTGLAGFYRLRYSPSVPSSSAPIDGDDYVMLSTHFEPSYARTAFPCFDEPNIKANFELCLEIPNDLVALSNMPVRACTLSDTDPMRKLVSFQQSPRMSTYLLTWAIGDFEYAEAFTERLYHRHRLPARIYVTRGLVHQVRFAMRHVGVLIDYFSELFGIDYPLPKLDLVAVHEFVSEFPSQNLRPQLCNSIAVSRCDGRLGIMYLSNHCNSLR